MTTIPDHVGEEAVRLLNETAGQDAWLWPEHRHNINVITVAKLLMDPPERMTDPDEEAALRIVRAMFDIPDYSVRREHLTRATEQLRKEFAARKEAWEAGR